MDDSRKQTAPADRPSRPARLGVSGRAVRWVYLLTLAMVTVVLAAVAGLIPATALADRPAAGIGDGAVAALATVAVGLLAAPLGGWRRVLARWPPLVVLAAANVVLLALFPPGWLLARLESDDALFRVATDRQVFALTIDDGLDPETTPALLDALARHDARATFFVLGETLDANEPLVRRLLAEGHELANHQWTDTPAVALPAGEARGEIERADASLRRFAAPRWFRPGGGVATAEALAAARGLGMRTALASVFPFDSHLAWTAFLAAHVEGRTRAGSIVVLHDRGDRGRRTAAALDAALPALRRRGLGAVTLSELSR